MYMLFNLTSLRKSLFLSSGNEYRGPQQYVRAFCCLCLDHHIWSSLIGHKHYFNFIKIWCEFTYLLGKGNGGWHSSEPVRWPRICATPETSIVLSVVGTRRQLHRDTYSVWIIVCLKKILMEYFVNKKEPEKNGQLLKNLDIHERFDWQ